MKRIMLSFDIVQFVSSPLTLISKRYSPAEIEDKLHMGTFKVEKTVPSEFSEHHPWGVIKHYKTDEVIALIDEIEYSAASDCYEEFVTEEVDI